MLHLLVAIIAGVVAYIIAKTSDASENLAVLIGFLVGLVIYLTAPW